MATTDSVTPVRPGPVILFSTGHFGHRVAAMLSASLPSWQLDGNDDIGDCFTTGGSAVVVALWRAASKVTRAADKLSFEHNIPWLPIIMEHPLLRVGPLVFPGKGPCFRCYSIRRAQHEPHFDSAADIEKFYDENTDAGPQGYLPQHARMAAAMATRMLSAVTAHSPGDAFPVPPGQVTSISLTSGSIAIERVVACHNCSRCRTRGAPGLNRSGRRDTHWPTDSRQKSALLTESRA
jgi:bacteriocin biosynthesis cyclodehydratase domain-containing protein